MLRFTGLDRAGVVTEPLYRDRIAAPLDMEKDPMFLSELFYTPTREVAPFRVVANDCGLSVDRLTYFGCMFFARLRGTAGIQLARHEFPGEWVVVEEGCLEGVQPSHFRAAREKSGWHHPLVSLGFGSQEACAAAISLGHVGDPGDSLPGEPTGTATAAAAADSSGGHCLDGAVRALLLARGHEAPPPWKESRMGFGDLTPWLARVGFNPVGFSLASSDVRAAIAASDSDAVIVGVELSNGAEHAFAVDRVAGKIYDVAEDPPARDLGAYLDELAAAGAHATHARSLRIRGRGRKRTSPSLSGAARRGAGKARAARAHAAA